jgi:hypothetical protein
MNPNHPEALWTALKAGCFPSTSGEDEKRLRIAFFQGIHAGREMCIQSANLNNSELVEFHRDLSGQLRAALKEMGQEPGKVDMKLRPKQVVKATINGETI